MKLIDKILQESNLLEAKIVTFPEPQGNYIVMLGSPGSGKSYIVNKYLDLNGFKHLTGDSWIEIKAKVKDIDLAIGKNTADLKGKIDPTFKDFRKNFIDRNATNTKSIPNIVVEITGKSLSSLTNVLDLAGENYTTTLIYVKTSKEECLRRNNQRTRKVPEDVLLDIYDSTEEVFNNAKGLFNHVWEIDNEGEHDGVVDGKYTRATDKIIKIK